MEGLRPFWRNVLVCWRTSIDHNEQVLRRLDCIDKRTSKQSVQIKNGMGDNQ